MKIKSVRGTHDIFGKNIKKFNIIKKIVSECAENNGFNQIITPIFEFNELFMKPLGEESDVVLKEMYAFEDRNKDILTLRPEYTTPMIRAAISNNLLNDLPLKIYGIGPMFRRERPQKGRFRQFNQINFEVFGSDDYITDVTLIFLANQILSKLLPNNNIVLNINSLGTKENMNDYKKSLKSFFNDKKSKLSEDSQNKIFSNPLRILDSKKEQDIEVCVKAPLIYEFFSKESKIHYERIKSSLQFLNINFKENPKLVRGLDYYCSTVFEFKTEDLGTQDTLLGGGRYDGLISSLGGPNLPGIGWAAGVERISMLMTQPDDVTKYVNIAITDKKFEEHLLKIINYLNSKKISYFWNHKYNLKKSLSKANQTKSKIIILIGEDEYKEDFYTIKELSTGKQSKIKTKQLDEYFK